MPAAKQIGILLFPEVEELDVAGPWEVLSFWTRNYPGDGYAVSCMSLSGGLVQCAKGLSCRLIIPSPTRLRSTSWCIPVARAREHSSATVFDFSGFVTSAPRCR